MNQERLWDQLAEILSMMSMLSLSYYLTSQGYGELLDDADLVRRALTSPELEAKRRELIDILRETNTPEEFKQKIFALTAEVGEMAGAKMIELKSRRIC